MGSRVSVALGLQEVVERQHAELAKLHEAQRAQRANKHPQQVRLLPPCICMHLLFSV